KDVRPDLAADGVRVHPEVSRHALPSRGRAARLGVGARGGAADRALRGAGTAPRRPSPERACAAADPSLRTSARVILSAAGAKDLLSPAGAKDLLFSAPHTIRARMG